MKYITGFRNPEAAAVIIARIKGIGAELQRQGRRARIMEVCGTHTMAISRCGIRGLLPENVDLISGPGCPVCVTDGGYIDGALQLARAGAAVFSFGDMLKVPGSKGSLAAVRAEGADVHVCYSPIEALDFAVEHPERAVVFLAIGFETTMAPAVAVLNRAVTAGVPNLSLLTAFKAVIPAMHALSSDPQVAIDAYLCPAHVSAIIGAAAYQPIVDAYRVPCVIAGFEALDILLGLQGILEQLAGGAARVDNQYSRVVTAEGNRKAQQLIEAYLVPADTPWRGIGVIPNSGLRIKDEFGRYDACTAHGIVLEASKPAGGCRCGEVLKGCIKPTECRLFGGVCNPEHPVGPCMVSSEGTCSAYFKYGASVD